MASKQDKQIIDLATGVILAAKNENKVSEVMENLNFVKQILGTNSQVRSALANPAVSIKNRYEALKKTFDNQIHQIVLNALGMMLERGLISLFGDFTLAVEDVAREEANYFICHITSAVDLSEENQNNLIKVLEKRLNGTVKLICKTDPKVIGGLSVTCGDWRYLGTVDAKLQQLSRHLVTMQ